MATLLALILFVTLTAVKQPYTKYFLNTLEILSLITSAVSVYFGVFFISGSSTHSTRSGKANVLNGSLVKI